MSKRINEQTKQLIVNKIRNEGLSVPQAADEFGVSRNAIYNWIGAKAKGEPSILELSRLKKENDQLKQIIGGLALEKERGKKNQKRQAHGRRTE